MAWWTALSGLGLPTTVYVTVDGDEDDAARVQNVVLGFAVVMRVGDPLSGDQHGRQGVAVNKNTGIEALMTHSSNEKYPDIEHLFLSDDDTWPLSTGALTEHLLHNDPHTMVCWGRHRMAQVHRGSVWTWPRGSMLYLRREVIVRMGGMIEAFGAGGHEHVEFSRRIHQAGMTSTLYPTPEVYFHDRGTGARRFWHAEDMPKYGEDMGALRARRARLTAVSRPAGYQEHIDKIMAARDGDTTFVPYRAADNGRASATLYHN